MDRQQYLLILIVYRKEIKMKDFIIEKFTELLIKQDFEDKKKGTDTYVKKTRVYQDIIQLLKEYDFNES